MRKRSLFERFIGIQREITENAEPHILYEQAVKELMQRIIESYGVDTYDNFDDWTKDAKYRFGHENKVYAEGQGITAILYYDYGNGNKNPRLGWFKGDYDMIGRGKGWLMTAGSLEEFKAI